MREPRIVGYSVYAILAVLIIALAIAAYAAPLVNIDKPRDKEIISGTADIHVSYAADSASPIERVEVYIDGQLAKDFSLDKPQSRGKVSFRWDFTAATPSRHSISARAQDTAGVVGTTGIKVEIRRAGGAQQASATGGADRTPPTVDIYYPEEGQVVSGIFHVKADVSDNVGVRTVIFYLDGKFKTMIMNSPNYTDRVDTAKLKLADGPHVVQVSAWDEAENEGRSEERTVIVRNHETTITKTGKDRVATKADTVIAPAPAGSVPKPKEPPVVEPVPGLSAPDVGPSPGTPPRTDSGTPAGAPSTSAGALMARAATGASAPHTSSPGTPGLPRRTDLQAHTGAPSTSADALAGTAATGASAPHTSVPTKSELPPPPPVEEVTPPSTTTAAGRPAEPDAKPSTSGPDTSLRAHTETRVALASAPIASAAAPLAAAGGQLKAAAPATRDVVKMVALNQDVSARESTPKDAVWQPKTTKIMGRPSVILAEPPPPKGAYASEPVGAPRQDAVAMLPPRRDEGAKSKIGIPQLNVAEMARFRDVKIVFDGKLIPLRSAPEVVDGISIAPLREIFEHCDGTLYWFHYEKRVHAVNPTTDMELTIGDATAKVNGAEEELILAPYIKNGRTMIPLEFVAGTLDVTVSFNSQTGELIISRNSF